MLSDVFLTALEKMGIPALEQPIFYHAPNGIRFAIGGEGPVYLKHCSMPNPTYILGAVYRAEQIYKHLPEMPDILCIELWQDERNLTGRERIAELCKKTELKEPKEWQRIFFQEEGRKGWKLRLFWDLRAFPFKAEKLLREIIHADIGGYRPLVSNVYFVDTRNIVLFHLYDDRGADLIAGDRETLRPIFEQFREWILEYDRERIEKLFL